MWANEEVAELVEGLRRHNDGLPEPERIGFYGLDVYSLWESLDAVMPGVAMHDGLSAYREYEGCEHALCNAHHLRELTFVEEEHKQEWAGRMKTLLSEIEESVREEAAWGGTRLEPKRVEKFEKRYQRLLEAGLAANPPPIRTGKKGRPKQSKGKNLVDRLDKHRREVLRFMHDFRVPFDNNRAERDLRMIKVRQKISGCFRTRRGAQMFCRIRGYISTARKQGENVLAALESVFVRDPFVLLISAQTSKLRSLAVLCNRG